MSAGKAADPRYWLGQLEDVLCDRFQNLGHQCAQIREEIVENIGNVIRDSAERDEWDVCNFIWRLLDEWEAHDLTDMGFSRPPSQYRHVISVGRIESLRYLPKHSSATSWDHASLCAGELCNTIRRVIDEPSTSFKRILMEHDVKRPEGEPPQNAESIGHARPTPSESLTVLDGGVHTWADYIDQLEIDLARVRKAVQVVKEQNMELAIKLADTQNRLVETQRSLGRYQHL